jgi:hypothetical protein
MGKTTREDATQQDQADLEVELQGGAKSGVLADQGNVLLRRIAEQPSSSGAELECPPDWGAELWPGPYPMDERQLTELGLALMALGRTQEEQQQQTNESTEQGNAPTTPRVDDPLYAAARRAITGETEEKDQKDEKQPSMTSWLAFGGTVAGLTLGAFANLHKVNSFADDFEHQLPKWARWSGSGDPVTWVHHSAFTAAATLGGAALGKITGIGAERGAKYAGLAAVLFYLGRELYGHVGRSHRGWDPFVDHRKFESGVHVGYVIDASMDVLLPYLTYRQLTKLFKK